MVRGAAAARSADDDGGVLAGCRLGQRTQAPTYDWTACRRGPDTFLTVNAAVFEALRLTAEHTPAEVRRRLTARPRVSYLSDFVYGAIGLTVTTFAVSSPVSRARTSARAS